ncbi:MAG: energy transducer TonB [Acidobacteria bacterium]|nr:energy transducer TonB [Acidobacteriota bacterium]
MKRTIAVIVLLGWCAAPVGAQDPLAAAKELYASARYDEALSILNGVRPGDRGVSRRAIEQYRSFCLLALGRAPEAEEAISAVVNSDPLYQPDVAEASPRVRTAFQVVRRRLLPEIASAQYARAKGTFDRKEYGTAAGQFRHVVALLDDPDMQGRLQDLRTLASGFVDLSAAAATPPPASKPQEPTPPRAPRPQSGYVYSSNDAGVTPPVIVRQELPRVPSTITTQARDKGVLEVVVDEQGRVQSIAVRMPVHPIYDAMMMKAARDWRYRPALFAGMPVKFRKLIQITIAR